MEPTLEPSFPWLWLFISGLTFLVGAAIGVLLGASRRVDAPVERELRDQLGRLSSRLDAALTEARDESARRAKAESEAETARLRQRALETEHASTLAERQAFFDRRIAEVRESHAQSLAELRTHHERALADLKESFRAISAEALKENTPAFLALARENLGKLQAESKGELETRKKEIESLLKPLEEQLRGFAALSQQGQKSIAEVAQQLGDLRKTNDLLASETSRFRMVLKSSQARGRWGEETLRRVVEAAGMSAHCDFDVQVSEGNARPDMVVRLPEDRVIIVDAKVPDLDFVDAMESADAQTRSESLRVHAAKLKQTIRELAGRDYPERFPSSLDYVVLFLPAESLFSAALEGDRELLVWAAEQRIILATPASLIALLRSVSLSWQQYSQTQNTREIADAAKELYERVALFYDHVAKIGRALKGAGEAYNAAVGSYERRVRPSGERLGRLEVASSGKDLPDLPEAHESLRLVADGEGAR
jgi:DNA recombination protein RmuC